MFYIRREHTAGTYEYCSLSSTGTFILDFTPDMLPSVFLPRDSRPTFGWEHLHYRQLLIRCYDTILELYDPVVGQVRKQQVTLRRRGVQQTSPIVDRPSCPGFVGLRASSNLAWMKKGDYYQSPPGLIDIVVDLIDLMDTVVTLDG